MTGSPKFWGIVLALALASAAAADDRPSITIAMAAMQRAHPAIAESNFDSRVIRSVLEGVLDRDWLAGPNGNDGTAIVPRLFTAHRQVDDLTWEFDVRQGVKFHNGREMTIDDVAFTLGEERLWGEKPIEPHTLGQSIAAVEIVDADTLRLRTRFPDPVLLQRLAHVIGHVVPKAEYLAAGREGFAAAPMGTGPYRWVRMVADEEIILEAFDDYWGGRPPLKQIRFVAVPEASARLAGLVTGEYDIITSVPPDMIELINREANYETRSIEVENMHHFTFMAGCGEDNSPCARNSPVQDPRVRRAMIHALDRARIADRLWNGLAKVPGGPNWQMYGDLFDADRKPLAYDPELAKKLLTEAGYDGREIVFGSVGNYYVNGDRAIEVAIQMWKQAGINVRLQKVENWAQMRPYGWQDLYMNSSNIRIPDPLSPVWWRFAEPTASYVLRGTTNPSEDHIRLGRILEQTLDPAARKAAFHELLDVWERDAPAIVLYRPIEIFGVRKDIKWTPYSFYWMDFRAENFSIAAVGQ